MDDLHERQSNALFQNKHIDASFVPGRQKSHTHTHTHTHTWQRGLELPMHVLQELPGCQGSADHERTLLGQLPSKDGGTWWGFKECSVGCQTSRPCTF